MKSKRVYATLTVAALLVSAFVFVPLPISRVRDTGIVTPDPSAASTIGLIDPGRLTELYSKEGQLVRKGELIARFDAPELREQRAEMQFRRDQRNEQATRLNEELLSEKNPASRAILQSEAQDAISEESQYDAQGKILDARLAGMRELRAPRDGIVSGLPKRSEVGKLFDRNYMQGQPVCTVSDPTRLIVKVPVSPMDYQLLKEDLPPGGALDVSVYVKGRTDHIFNGKLRRLPESDARQVPFALTQRGGGSLAVKQSGEGGQELSPLGQVYLIEVDMIDPDGSMKPGALVSVKVHCQWRSGAWWCWRKFCEALDIGLY